MVYLDAQKKLVWWLIIDQRVLFSVLARESSGWQKNNRDLREVFEMVKK